MSRERFSTQVSPNVADRARATVAGMLAVDPDFSLAQLVEQALASEIARLEREHHGGRPWPGVARRLRPGRRVQGAVGE